MLIEQNIDQFCNFVISITENENNVKIEENEETFLIKNQQKHNIKEWTEHRNQSHSNDKVNQIINESILANEFQAMVDDFFEKTSIKPNETAKIPSKSVGNKINVSIFADDLIDMRNESVSIYIEFFQKYVSYCDSSKSIYTMFEGKLSKSLQRRMVSLDQKLRQGKQIPFSDGLEINSKTSYEEVLAKLGDNDEAVFAYIAKNQEYKNKLFRLLRSICERVLIYGASLCEQFHHQVQNKTSMSKSSTDINTTATKPLNVLWNELRSRSCQFLGPQTQEDVLHFIIRALGPFKRLTRRVLVSYIVFMLKNDYPKISKTSVGNVVQLLYRAGCFKVEKRDKDTSLIELKREYSKYESLRRQHDSQIIQIGIETGIRMTPEKWSQTLYGDTDHKSEMQSIIDKLQSVHTIDDLIGSIYEKLDSYSLRGLSSMFNEVRIDFEFIASINFEKKLKPKYINFSIDDDLEINLNFSNDGKFKSNSPFQSDDDQKSEYSEDKYWNVSSNHSNSQEELSKKPEVEQDRISWQLLATCLQKTLNIIIAHAEFSNRLMSMIIANQNASNNEMSQSFSFNRYGGANNSNWRQQPWSQNRQQTQQRYQPQFNQMNQNQRADFQPQFNRNQNGAFRFPDSRNQHQQSSYRPQSSFRNAYNSNANSSFYPNRRNPNFQN